MTAMDFIEERFSAMPYELDDVINLMIDFAKYHLEEALLEIEANGNDYINNEGETLIDVNRLRDLYPSSEIK